MAAGDESKTMASVSSKATDKRSQLQTSLYDVRKTHIAGDRRYATQLRQGGRKEQGNREEQSALHSLRVQDRPAALCTAALLVLEEGGMTWDINRGTTAGDGRVVQKSYVKINRASLRGLLMRAHHPTQLGLTPALHPCLT